MNNNIKTVEKYFELSNHANLAEVSRMLSDDSTYESSRMGVCRGADEILKGMTTFFDGFSELKWVMTSIKETKPGNVEVDFTFKGLTKEGLEVNNAGTEYFSVQDDKLKSIIVRSK